MRPAAIAERLRSGIRPPRAVPVGTRVRPPTPPPGCAHVIRPGTTPAPLLTCQLFCYDYRPIQDGPSSAQLVLRIPTTWGGARRGAGRRPAPGRRSVRHERRDSHDPHAPSRPIICTSSSKPTRRRGSRAAHRACRSASRRRSTASSGAAAGSGATAITPATRRRRVRSGTRSSTCSTTRGSTCRSFADFDPCSSAAWFNGWRQAPTIVAGSPPVAQPRTWLVRIGWRRHGLLHANEAPRQGVPAPPRR